MKPLFFALLFSLLSYAGRAQDSSLRASLTFSNKVYEGITKKTTSVGNKLERKVHRYLSKFQKQEVKLQRKIQRKDSLLAKSLFASSKQQYEQLKELPQGVSKFSNVYSGHLDSLSTALKFIGSTNVPSQKLDESLQRLNLFQQQLNQTDRIKKFIAARKQLLQDQLQKLGIVKELKKYEKSVYYYGAQIREYKDAFESPDKLERKLLETLSQNVVFKDFFARNSQLGSLFSLSANSSSTNAIIPGLQTRTAMRAALQDRFGSSMSMQTAMQQGLGASQTALQDLKAKAGKVQSGSFGNNSEDVETPNFKPNNQKTKSLFQRLEYGGNLQSQKARNYFPATSDIGFSLGYKLNDKSIIGIGTSYKLGLGKGWNNISFSHQGVSLRSFIDYKLKGSLYLSGGYEQNYRQLFTSLDPLKNYNAWQSSGLLGLSKKYSLTKKVRGNVQLLWDFLSYRQMPQTQAILFRVGYSLK